MNENEDNVNEMGTANYIGCSRYDEIVREILESKRKQCYKRKRKAKKRNNK